MRIRLTILLLALVGSSCAKMNPNQLGSTDAASVGPVPVPLGQAFALSDPGPRSANLASSQDISVQITAANDFSGGIDLSIERDELNAVDLGNAITITAVPSHIELKAGETKAFAVHIEAQSMAPGFNDHFHLVAKESGVSGTPREAVSVVPFKINPLIEIDLHGGASPELFVPAFSSVSMKAHAGGVTVRFVNYDKNLAHIIHGQGAIPHQNTANPMAAAPASGPGGSYEIKVTSTTANLQGQFYCHSHESGAQARTVNFNVP